MADPPNGGQIIAISEEGLYITVRLKGSAEGRWKCPVEFQEVDLIDSEFSSTLVERLQDLVIAEVTDPNLGLQESFGSVQSGVVCRFSDLPFVRVGCGGVDVPISGAERSAHRAKGLPGGVWEAPGPRTVLRRRC